MGIVVSIWKNIFENNTTGMRRWGIFYYDFIKVSLTFVLKFRDAT